MFFLFISPILKQNYQWRIRTPLCYLTYSRRWAASRSCVGSIRLLTHYTEILICRICCLLGDTFDNICKDIEDQLRADKNTRYGNIRNALQRALNVGQSLGIITLSNETIRMPFNFRSTSVAKGKARDDVQQVPQPPIGTGNPPVAQNTNERSAAALPKKRVSCLSLL